ncbi:hypothetical protein HD806DRAFT_520639 [Xylariaceae sp. AK1471]|nr:hypothetical protein HD806DRAFT_520639 [Xylariaceae sp. AK1471]
MVKLDFGLEQDVPELMGKVIMITGGTHTSRNPAKIYITECNKSAAQHVIANIKPTGTNTETEFRFDVLMANAGIMALPPGLTNDGYELYCSVCCKKMAKEHGEARVIPASSLALVLAPQGHGIVFNDLKTTQAYWILRKGQTGPGPSNTGLVWNLGGLNNMIVYLGHINRFLNGELYEPAGKPNQRYTHWCLDLQLAVRL